MRLLRGSIALTALVFTAACQPAGDGLAYDQAPLDTENQKASYSLGLEFGGQLAIASDRIDLAAFTRGIRDAMEERDFAMTDEERMTVMESFSAAVRESIAAEREAEAAANREEGATLLAENGARPEVTTTESGVQWEVLTAADGPRPSPTDNVTIHYHGTTADGEIFDTTRDDGNPATFNLQGVIAGFTEALLLMETGSTYRFVIPSDLAYGPGGSQSIGPDKTLIFEIELLEIEPTG